MEGSGELFGSEDALLISSYDEVKQKDSIRLAIPAALGALFSRGTSFRTTARKPSAEKSVCLSKSDINNLIKCDEAKCRHLERRNKQRIWRFSQAWVENLSIGKRTGVFLKVLFIFIKTLDYRA
jgi:hypothetical protein